MSMRIHDWVVLALAAGVFVWLFKERIQNWLLDMAVAVLYGRKRK